MFFLKKWLKSLKHYEKKANLTQREVANLLGLKSKYGGSFIARLENGLFAKL